MMTYYCWQIHLPVQLVLPGNNACCAPLAHSVTTVPQGRAIAQAVSRWLPTAAARVRAWVWSSGICGGQSGAGAGFLLVTSVSPANFHSTNYSTITLIYHLVLYNRSEVAAVPGDISPTTLIIIIKKKLKKKFLCAVYTLKHAVA
jgi:hypothetical protein